MAFRQLKSKAGVASNHHSDAKTSANVKTLTPTAKNVSGAGGVDHSSAFHNKLMASSKDIDSAIDFQAALQEARAAALLEHRAGHAKPTVGKFSPAKHDQHRLSVPWEGGACWYYPDFLTHLEEATLLREIYGSAELQSVLPEMAATLSQAPDVSGDHSKNQASTDFVLPGTKWVKLTKRRLQNLGGVPHSNGMYAEAPPPWLATMFQRIHDTQVLRTVDGEDDDSCILYPNQCLLNEYRSGQGISPHKDGPLYKPAAAILSLHSPGVLHFFPRAEREASCTVAAASVVLRPRSLFVFAGAAYEDFWHGLADTEADIVGADDVAVLNMDLAKARKGEVIDRCDPRVSLTVRRTAKVYREHDDVLTTADKEEKQRRHQWWTRAISEQYT